MLPVLRSTLWAALNSPIMRVDDADGLERRGVRSCAAAPETQPPHNTRSSRRERVAHPPDGQVVVDEQREAHRSDAALQGAQADVGADEDLRCRRLPRLAYDRRWITV